MTRHAHLAGAWAVTGKSAWRDPGALIGVLAGDSFIDADPHTTAGSGRLRAYIASQRPGRAVR